MENKIPKNIAKNSYLPKLPYLNQERSEKFIGIALTLIALSLFGLFAISPTISTILKLQKEFSDSQIVYNELDSKIKNLSLLRQEYSGIQNDLPIVTDAIPNIPNTHILLAQIQGAAQQSNVNINKLQNFEVEIIKNSEGAERKPYYSFSFSAAGEGSFENINNFVSTIANMQRVIDVEVFTISNTSIKNSQSLDFNIQGVAFFKE
ncbi:MAG: type 4a pilus biogenesis protein PilO [Candidatus Levybacteria bacterium]|nr:type 4a pilus biogenesis protein PilO [Candidatus Levybacteria bacterium]